jgi:Zn-dependent M28 family amino/carboxypeptidase
MKTNRSPKRIGLVAAVAAALAVYVAYGVQRPSAAQMPAVPKQTPFNGDRAFEDLKKMIAFGPRPSGSDAIVKTRQYIVAELEKAGLKPILDEFVGQTPRGNIKMVNIRAIRAGAKPTTIAVTGHYDTKRFAEFRFDGASDGGSSAAWVLEMARASSNLKLENSLEFIFFDGEEAVVEWTENDSVYGSRYDRDRRNKAGQLKDLKALILVDMIGDKNLNIKRESASTSWMTAVIWDTAHAMGYNREFVDESIPIEDDHLPYLKAGVNAVDLIDFDYPHWHTAGDTLDKTSARSLKVVGDVVYAALPEIDKRANQ